VFAFVKWWSHRPWMYLMTAVGAAVAIALVANWGDWTIQRKLLAGSVIVLVLHVWEEWRFPGGLHYAYNRQMGGNDNDAADRYPMSELTDSLTNLGGTLAGAAAVVWAGDSWPAAIAVALVCLLESIVHPLVGLRFRKQFRTVYNPGLFTTALGFLPLTIAYIVLFSTGAVANGWDWVIGIVVFAVVIFIFLRGPELLFADRESKYPFPSDGFYARFATDGVSRLDRDEG